MRGVGKALIVEVVQQADDAPRLRVFAELGGVGAHRRLDGQHVLAQRRRLGVLLHQGEGVGAIHQVTFQRSAHSSAISTGHSLRAWLARPARCSANSAGTRSGARCGAAR